MVSRPNLTTTEQWSNCISLCSGYKFSNSDCIRQNCNFSIRNLSTRCFYALITHLLWSFKGQKTRILLVLTCISYYLFLFQHTTKIVRWIPASDDVSPMEAVGSFLTNLFQVLNRQAFSPLPKRYNDGLAEFSHSSTTPLSPHPEEEFVNVLHSALDFTQGELIGLVLRIYGGPPEPFELLHCNCSTTEDDVKLFMKRIHQHPRQYLVLEVNHLPFQLQEVGKLCKAST